MRKIFWQISATLDGYMEGRNRELNDPAGTVDVDFDRYASEMLKSLLAATTMSTGMVALNYEPTWAS